ncbi:hypothetical protein [Desulfosporosinus shakirovi]|nr:hypothetical protein [Desulfosporosinus sp. SRJS8]
MLNIVSIPGFRVEKQRSGLEVLTLLAQVISNEDTLGIMSE